MERKNGKEEGEGRRERKKGRGRWDDEERRTREGKVEGEVVGGVV